jgi:hypothetical protein
MNPKLDKVCTVALLFIRPLSRKAIHLIRNYNRKMFERTQWRNDKISSTTNHYIFFIDRAKKTIRAIHGI